MRFACTARARRMGAGVVERRFAPEKSICELRVHRKTLKTPLISICERFTATHSCGEGHFGTDGAASFGVTFSEPIVFPVQKA